mgnify:CR=1 FL=1
MTAMREHKNLRDRNAGIYDRFMRKTGWYTKKYEQIHSTIGGNFNETHSF